MADDSTSAESGRREPIFNMPFIILLLIAGLAAIHFVRDQWLDDRAFNAVLRDFAFVPARLSAAFDMNEIAAALTGLARDPAQLATARYFLGDGNSSWWTLVTYAGLHGDWVHTGVNCLWLAAFGGPVAMRLGWLRFLVLFVVTAVAGALMHFAFHRLEFVPLVGASAAVSGIMAAAIRFVFQPGAPLGPRLSAMALPPHLAVRLPAVSLAVAIFDRRVLQFTLIWFAINLVFGLVSQPLGMTASSVAWEAHVGGFIAGFLLFGLFDPPAPDPRVFGPWLESDYVSHENNV